jgi:uncharacterized protein DUF6879
MWRLDQAGLQRFLVGESKPERHNASWTATVRANLDAGKTMRRLKVVRRPFGDYTRFLFAWAIPGNVAAGEDRHGVRLERQHAERRALEVTEQRPQFLAGHQGH